MPAAADSSPAIQDALADAYARWRAVVDSELKGAPFDKKLVSRTPEGIAVQPLYTRAHLAGVPDLDTRPGVAPYLRGVRPLGYKTRRWEIAQRIAAATPAEFNAAIRPDLMQGQNAVVLAPDRATRAGADPDEAAPAHVGAEGVSLADVNDVEAALQGVALDAVPLYVNAGADPLPVAALLLEAVRRSGTGWTELTGSVTADPLGEWIARGQLPGSLAGLYDALAGWTTWVDGRAPALRTIGVDLSVWGNAGATAVQELAFALATAAEYMRALDQRGVTPGSVVRRMEFRFAAGPQFFTEIAKLRAFRPLWTRVVTAFGVSPEAAARAAVSVETGAWNKTLLDPHVNMLRVTTEALSAVLGGCDRLHIAPFDEVAGTTNDFSRRIARNVHVLLAEEFSFAETADPAGGSWYVEKLTDELARAAWTLFQDVEARGGMAAALRTGYPQELAAKSAAEKREGLAKRRVGLVGTNLFPNLKETPLVGDGAEATKRRNGRAEEIRARRSDANGLLATDGDWTARFEAALLAARAGATVSQLSSASRQTRVPTEQIAPVTPWRAAEDFEALRAAAATFARRTGARPKVFLAKMGPVVQHKARADFAAGFFAVGGFEVIARESFSTADEAAAAAARSQAAIVVLCSTDETYPELVPVFAAAVRASAPGATIVLAGLPADATTLAAFRAAGVDEFIHLRANVPELLAALLRKIGALS